MAFVAYKKLNRVVFNGHYVHLIGIARMKNSTRGGLVFFLSLFLVFLLRFFFQVSSLILYFRTNAIVT